MSNQTPNLPRTNAGGELQAIQPTKALNDEILDFGATAVVTSTALETTAAYVYVTAPCHIRFSRRGEDATEIYAPIGAGEHTIACSVGDKVSLLGLDGETGRAWVCPVKS
ncbi:hypothetical protein AB3A32_002619 [Vibrio alginolyticus]